MDAKPNSTVVYLLWFFTGIIGLHHVYLNNINRAIICFMTLNYFFLGWIYDLMNLDSYIEECSYFAQVRDKIPPFSIFRILCNMISSLFFSAFIKTLFPFFKHFTVYFHNFFYRILDGEFLSITQLNFVTSLILQLLIVYFSIWGIQFFSESTKTKSSYTLMLILDLLYVYKANYKISFSSFKVVFWELSVINALLFEAKRRRKEFNYNKRRNIFIRLFLYGFGIAMLFSMFLVIVSVNIEINRKGKSEKLYKVIYDLVTDAQFKAILKIFGREVKVFYYNYKTVGFEKAFNSSFKEEGANSRIDQDFKVLGITESNVNYDLIKRKHRKLVQKWHPDVTKENKEEAENKIKEINDSFERLKRIYK
eukprot:GAHX01001969.1.p1 GENE.GAHX01001969.1~~GAHX01001969.1.p1  ORF type:complete len:376 (+),score=68.41 GAHX01001969.1:36-1130(+)